MINHKVWNHSKIFRVPASARHHAVGNHQHIRPEFYLDKIILVGQIGCTCKKNVIRGGEWVVYVMRDTDKVVWAFRKKRACNFQLMKSDRRWGTQKKTVNSNWRGGYMWSLPSGAVNIRLNYMKWLGWGGGYGSNSQILASLYNWPSRTLLCVHGLWDCGGEKTSFSMTLVCLVKFKITFNTQDGTGVKIWE